MESSGGHARMRETSVIEVNLSAIDRNVALLREIVGPGCGLCPIVKADAYGLGGARVARRLAASGVDLLAVYSPDQAASLARGAVAAPVLVLMPVYDITRTDDLYRALVSGQLHLTLHDEPHFERLVKIAERFGAVIPVHLEIDTGMSRGGASPTEAIRLLRRVAATRWLRLAGIFTHFSNARTDAARTSAQLAAFDAVLDEPGVVIPSDCVRHVASTYSLLRHSRFHRSMVRFGLAWAGYGADDLTRGSDGEQCAFDGTVTPTGEIVAGAERLEPSVTWASRLVQLKTVEAETSVGYGSLWTAPRRSVLGLVPVGYADGYPVTRVPSPGSTGPGSTGHGSTGHGSTGHGSTGHGSSGHGSRGAPPLVAVLVGASGAERRLFAPVVGAVNMDQLTIDLTDVVGASSPGDTGVAVGTRVELITADCAAPNHLPRIAAAAGTIPHEMLCRLNPSIRRAYLSEGKAVELSPPSIAAVAS